MRELVLAVDLGATKILTGIVGTDGAIIGRSRVPTPGDNPDEALDMIADSARALVESYAIREEEIAGIAVATPGPLAFPEGVVKSSPNLGWKEVEFQKEMSRRFGRPVIVEKDTNMAALGELRYGRCANCRELLYVTVSTGVGAGIVIAGKLYRGKSGGAGEFGHMVIDAGGALCRCGRRGCMEALVSGSAISRQLDEMFKQGSGRGILACTPAGVKAGARELGRAARQGDQEARTMIARLTEYLGIGIANMVNVLNPEAVVLGGGVMLGLKDLLLQPVREYVFQHTFALNREKLALDVTALGDDVVLYGCLAAVLENRH